MPNICIHEIVGYKLSEKYKMLDNLDFYLGMLSPDAVNYRKFESKEIRWASHIRSKNLDKWQDDVIRFYYDNIEFYNKYFLLGYVIHIITDIIFDRDFYDKVKNNILSSGFSDDDAHQVMRDDMDKYSNNNDIWNKMKEKIYKIDRYYDILNVSKNMESRMIDVTLKKTFVGDSVYINDDIIKQLTFKVEKVLEELIERI